MLELQMQILSNSAATLLQRRLRGMIVRRRLDRDTKAYKFFTRVQKAVQVRDLVVGLKNAFLFIKDRKQRFLKKYIFWAATRIQSLFRGYQARKTKIPIRRSMRGSIKVLEAAALGWKVRRIMKLKEVKNRVQQIKEFEMARVDTMREATLTAELGEKQKLLGLVSGLEQSRLTTVASLLNLVRKLSEKSLWLTYAAAEQAGEELRTPRRMQNTVAAENFLKRGSRTSLKPAKVIDSCTRVDTQEFRSGFNLKLP